MTRAEAYAYLGTAPELSVECVDGELAIHREVLADLLVAGELVLRERADGRIAMVIATQSNHPTKVGLQ